VIIHRGTMGVIHEGRIDPQQDDTLCGMRVPESQVTFTDNYDCVGCQEEAAFLYSERKAWRDIVVRQA